jgi:NAD(P)-dependent dehydrogenase (short-subunit alcohol dehydrogenase family)
MLVALVTGANRGIGLEVCRQLARIGMHVILTGRARADVTSAAQDLRTTGLNVDGEVMDVAVEASVTACAARLRDQTVQVDVLVKNAGVYPDGDLLTGSSKRADGSPQLRGPPRR